MSIRISKFLSLVLRHDPERIGIVLDEAGWTDVAALLAAAAAHGVPITRGELDEIVATSDKQRFALSPDGTRIRANQGHSVEVELGLAPAVPPERLFHGTVARFVESIRELGILKGARHHVHLSADEDTAKRVGGRRGAPVVLGVRAGEMARAGHVFYRSDNGVWLVDHVPAAFVELPAPRGSGKGSRGDKVRIAKATLAACEQRAYTNARGERVELAFDPAATVLHEAPPPWSARAAATRIAVTDESTIAAIARLGDGCVALNFASAKNPGGGFLGGAQAQEETLARSSALYPCIAAARGFYDANRAARSALYTDRALYSPRVPFFRDDDGGWFDAPVHAGVITCAAPNARALREHGRFDADEVTRTLVRRAELVLPVAAHHAATHLVLGAWGAGVFGNDPAIVARAFAEPLRGAFAGVFAEIVFAVPDPSGANHRAFAAAFG
jgi:putative RNA 2'-phosphotransferase